MSLTRALERMLGAAFAKAAPPGTHPVKRTRKDGVSQTYHVGSGRQPAQRPAPAAKPPSAPKAAPTAPKPVRAVQGAQAPRSEGTPKPPIAKPPAGAAPKPEPKGEPAPAEPRPIRGSRATAPRPAGSGSTRAKIVKRDGDTVTLQAGDDHPLVPKGNPYDVPTASLEHHLDEIHHRVRGMPASGNDSVNAVIRGDGKLLGRGNDGMVFRVGDKVVKVGIVTPYHASVTRMYRTPREATERLKGQVAIGEHLRKLGVPMIPETDFVEYDERGYAIRDYMDIPKRLTRDELDEVQRGIIAMHDQGYVVRDEIQVGRGKDGKLYHFDLGSAAKGKGKGEGIGAYQDGDFGNDFDRLETLYRKHGETFEALGGVGLERDLRMASAGALFAGKIQKKHGDTEPRDEYLGKLESVYRRAVAEAKRTSEGKERETHLKRLWETVENALMEMDLPTDTIAKGKQASMFEGLLIPTKKVVRRKTGKTHVQTFHTAPARPAAEQGGIFDAPASSPPPLTERTGRAYDGGGGQTMPDAAPTATPRRSRDEHGYLKPHPRVFINGVRKGYRSASVIVWPDGSMTRGDVRLDFATTIPNLTAAARVVGMTRDEFIAARDAARAAEATPEPEPAPEPEPTPAPAAEPAKPRVIKRVYDIHETANGWRIEQTHESFPSASEAAAAVYAYGTTDSDSNAASIVATINWHPTTAVGSVVAQTVTKMGKPDLRPKPAPKPRLRRLAPGLYEATMDIGGKPATFQIEKIGRGDTDYASDVGLWAVHVDGDTGEPWYRTLADAKAYVFGDNWERHPQYGVVAKTAPAPAPEPTPEPEPTRKARARSVTDPETTLEDSREYKAGEREGLRMGKIARSRNLSREDGWHFATHEQNLPKYIEEAPETDAGQEDDPHIAYGMGFGEGFNEAYRGVPDRGTPEPEAPAEPDPYDQRPAGDPATMPSVHDDDDEDRDYVESLEYATGYAIGMDNARTFTGSQSDAGSLADRLADRFIDDPGMKRALPYRVATGLYATRARDALRHGISRGIWNNYERLDATVFDAIDAAGGEPIPSYLDEFTTQADDAIARERGAQAAAERIEQGRARFYDYETPAWPKNHSKAFQEAFERGYREAFENLGPWPDERHESSDTPAYKSGVRFARKFLHEHPVPADATHDDAINLSHKMYWDHFSAIPKRIKDGKNRDDDFLFSAAIANTVWDARGETAKAPPPKADPTEELPNADELRAEHARAVAEAAAVPALDEPQPDFETNQREWSAWYGRKSANDHERMIPVPPITYPHTPSQAKTFERWWNGAMDGNDAATHEIKSLAFEPSRVGLFVRVEVGRTSDEGTLAASFARDRYHLIIGPKGALRSHDGETFVSGQKAWYTRSK